MIPRILFLGTPDFAVPTLQSLLENPDFKLTGVITQPDRPAGRGQRLSAPPIKRLAQTHGLPLLQPPRLKGNQEAMAFLRRCSPDLTVVVAFGQLLPRSFFDWPRWGSINIHASLLPRYRGAAPVIHALLNGERETGVTIMRINEGLDTGDILSRRPVQVDENWTAADLSPRLAQEGADLLVETIPPWVEGRLQPSPQDHQQATLAPLIRKSQARIDWGLSAWAVHNHIRAFNPWPGAFTEFRGQTLKIWKSLSPGNSAPGTQTVARRVCSVGREGLEVTTSDGGRLTLSELQLPGRKRMSALDFANGVGLAEGEFLA